MPDNFTKEGIDMLKDNLDLCIKKPKYYKAFVAIENKKVVGFISYGDTYRRGEVIKLEWIVVSKKYQKIGIASRLVKKVEDKIKKYNARIFWVDTLDESIKYEPYVAANKFYKKMGFKKEVVLRGFYNSNTHQAIYVKRYRK